MKISRSQIRKILIKESLARGDVRKPGRTQPAYESERIRLLVRKLLREMRARSK